MMETFLVLGVCTESCSQMALVMLVYTGVMTKCHDADTFDSWPLVWAGVAFYGYLNADGFNNGDQGCFYTSRWADHWGLVHFIKIKDTLIRTDTEVRFISSHTPFVSLHIHLAVSLCVVSNSGPLISDTMTLCSQTPCRRSVISDIQQVWTHLDLLSDLFYWLDKLQMHMILYHPELQMCESQGCFIDGSDGYGTFKKRILNKNYSNSSYNLS